MSHRKIQSREHKRCLSLCSGDLQIVHAQTPIGTGRLPSSINMLFIKAGWRRGLTQCGHRKITVLERKARQIERNFLGLCLCHRWCNTLQNRSGWSDADSQPATRLNQILHRGEIGWARWGLNPRPKDYESPALTAELQARVFLLSTGYDNHWVGFCECFGPHTVRIENLQPRLQATWAAFVRQDQTNKNESENRNGTTDSATHPKG